MSEALTEEMQEEEFIEDTLKGKYLTFNLEKEFYGIEIRYVVEIIGMQPITTVPELPTYIRGIINLRGKIIPVMDVRLRFGKAIRDYDDRTCVIVVEIKDMSVGLIVDSVAEVQTIPEEEIVPPPDMSAAKHRFIQGVGKFGGQVKLLLDCNRLLSSNEIDDLANLS